MESKEKELSPIQKAAIKVIDKLKEQVMNDCDDEQIADTLVKCHPSAHDEYINPKDYCNADKAMDMLHLGYNRSKFFALTKKYGIKNHKVNNQPIGFLIKDIERLKEILIN